MVRVVDYSWEGDPPILAGVPRIKIIGAKLAGRRDWCVLHERVRTAAGVQRAATYSFSHAFANLPVVDSARVYVRTYTL